VHSLPCCNFVAAALPIAGGEEIRAGLTRLTGGYRTVPQVFIGGEFVGGANETMNEWGIGMLQSKLKSAGVTFDDDE